MKSPMQAFVSVDFDCEFKLEWNNKEISYQIGLLASISDNLQATNYSKTKGLSSQLCRPRLNKAQVLTDYTPILVDGFVWEVHLTHFIEDARWSEPCKFMIKSVRLKNDYTTDEDYTILSIAFKGVEIGSEYEEWARANDVPIYNKDMEPVA